MRTKSTGLKIRNLGNDAYSVDSPSCLAFAPFIRWNFEADQWKDVPYHVGDARVPKSGVHGRDRSNLRHI